MLKPGFLFTPNPDILTHKHTGLLSDTSVNTHRDLTRMKDLLVFVDNQYLFIEQEEPSV